MKKFATIIVLVIVSIFLFTSSARSALSVVSGCGTLTGNVITVDCKGFEGLVLKANVTVKGTSNLKVTYKAYDEKSAMTGFVSQDNDSTQVYHKIMGYINSTVNDTPTIYLPIPRNSETCYIVIDDCNGCTASLSVIPDDVSR